MYSQVVFIALLPCRLYETQGVCHPIPTQDATQRDAAGVWYELPDGRREPFSLANNYDPGFSPPPPYDPRVRYGV